MRWTARDRFPIRLESVCLFLLDCPPARYGPVAPAYVRKPTRGRQADAAHHRRPHPRSRRTGRRAAVRLQDRTRPLPVVVGRQTRRQEVPRRRTVATVPNGREGENGPRSVRRHRQGAELPRRTRQSEAGDRRLRAHPGRAPRRGATVARRSEANCRRDGWVAEGDFFSGPPLPPGEGGTSKDKTNLSALLFSALQRWQAATPVARDCPLPDLYRALESQPTVGEFHDALRQLHADGRIYLHPWTGPLYALPDPPFALLVGHEIAYYVSPR